MHRKIAVTTVAAGGFATISLRNRRLFRFAGRKNCRQPLAIFGVSLKNRRKLATTTATSRRSRAISRPQRPRDTEVRNQEKGGLEGSFAIISAFFGHGSLSAKCTAGPMSLNNFCLLERDTLASANKNLCENPLVLVRDHCSCPHPAPGMEAGQLKKEVLLQSRLGSHCSTWAEGALNSKLLGFCHTRVLGNSAPPGLLSSPARRMAAGKSAPRSATLLGFLLPDCHSLPEFSDKQKHGNKSTMKILHHNMFCLSCCCCCPWDGADSKVPPLF